MLGGGQDGMGVCAYQPRSKSERRANSREGLPSCPSLGAIGFCESLGGRANRSALDFEG
jgi:hypothetical protein